MTKILKKDGVEIMGEHRLPNPPFPGGHNTAFTPTQGLRISDQVIQATKEAQREALAQHSADEAELGIEDDAIAQLEADDRFEYTVDELVDLVPRLRADCECCRDVIESGPLTESVQLLLKTHWYACEAELRRLKAGRVVVPDARVDTL